MISAAARTDTAIAIPIGMPATRIWTIIVLAGIIIDAAVVFAAAFPIMMGTAMIHMDDFITSQTAVYAMTISASA
ncbi:hypothetical protein [Domibacillus indicus]|uniref:hypothetical protein n=1 Tax=Domibacillus indicus TaxID=1437523 RepID=UPI0012E0ACBE|nr:hypothetical protein [Domibacillus indicus]